MQTILGAGGAIGVELAKALPKYTNQIRLVSRNPEMVNSTDQLKSADLLNPGDVNKAVEGSDIVYLTAGLEYNINVWEKQWPVVMRNVLDACTTHSAKLVFFDNVYMYASENLNPMIESHEINPVSKKGKVRAQIIRMLWDSVEKNGLEALIARSADFYGPLMKKPSSFLVEGVFKPLHQGKKANWLGSDKYMHSFTYTPDAGKSTALLGNTPDAYGESWHLPTAPNPPTGKEWVELIARELGGEPKYRVASKTIVKIMGMFMPLMRESVEMLYQYDRDYVFDSSKFEERFKMKPTSYEKGVKQVVRTLE